VGSRQDRCNIFPGLQERPSPGLPTPKKLSSSLLPDFDCTVSTATDTQLRSNIVVETDAGTRGRGDAQKMNLLRMNATWYDNSSLFKLVISNRDYASFNLSFA